MHIAKYAALFVLLLAGVTGAAQEQVAERTFGVAPFSSIERPFTVRTIGERHVVVGDKDNDETLGQDIYFWFFDPETKMFTDSMAINQREDQSYRSSYPGPDGGLLVTYSRGFSDLREFAYFGPDATLSWSVEVPNVNTSNGLLAVSFISAEELLVSISPRDGTDRLVRLSSNGSVETIPVIFPSNGRLMSLQYLPNNTVLAGGDYSGGTLETGEVFVVNLTMAGEVIWQENLVLGEFNETAFTYDYMSDVHRPAGDTIIAITGAAEVGISGRRFITILDTLGRVLEEYITMDSGMGFYRDETDWNDGESLFTENLNGIHASLTRLENYRPIDETLTVEWLRGSYYDAPSNQIISTSINSSSGGDRNGALHFLNLENNEELVLSIGATSTGGIDQGLKLFAREDGGLAFMALTARRDFVLQPELFLLDSFYNVTDRIPFGSLLSPDPMLEVFQRNNDDILMVRRRRSGGPQAALLIAQFSPEGELRQNSVLNIRDENVDIQVIELSTGQLVVFDHLMITNSDPPLNKAFLYLLDENNELMSSVVGGDFRVAGSTGIAASSTDQVLIRASDPMLDSVRIISINPQTRGINWDYSAGSTFAADAMSINQMVVLSDGTIAALLLEEKDNQPIVVSYLRLTAEGEEIDREEIYRGTSPEQLFEFNLDVREDGTALVTFNRVNEGAILEERYTFFALRYDPVAKERIYLNAFPDSGKRATVNDVEELSTGNVAVLSTGFGSANTADEDIFLLIFRGGELLNAVFNTELPPNTVSVAPNPTFGPLKIDLSDASSGPYSMVVFDAFGRVVSRHQVPLGGNTLSLDLGDQPNGTYLLLVMDGNKRGTTRKIIVQK